jgi:hypothetical protein
VDPNLAAIVHDPVSGFPDIIIAADVITGAARVIRPVANLHRDRSRVTISISGTVAIAGTVPVTRAVPRIPAVVLVSTSPCTTRNTNEQHRKTHPPDCPLPPGGSRLCVINDVHLNIVFGSGRGFTCLNWAIGAAGNPGSGSGVKSHEFRVPRQAGYFGQPQNFPPTFEPRLAVFSSISESQRGQAGAR